MATTPAKRQRGPPPAAGEGELEGKRTRLTAPLDSADYPRRVVLNPADCDLDFNVDGNGLQGQALHEEGFAYCWSGARATIGITGGKYCFGCRIISEQNVQMEDTAPDQRHLCRLGISRGDDPVGNLGESDHSFGFGGTGKFSTAGRFSDYGEKFGVGDTIICAVNLESRPLASIGYSLNGKWLGIAKQFDAGMNGLGVLNSSPSKLSWRSALFPHILLKNVVIQMQFSIEDGLIPKEGYKPWSSAVEDGYAMIGPSFPSLKECEVMMMVGLPASGKTTWAEKWVNDHPEKRYVLLGTNLALDHMKVPGLLRKQNYGERFDRLMDRATKIFNTLLSRACRTPHNYIIDQTNVYKSARKRKLQPFVQFRKVAVVIFPTPKELKSRAERRSKEMGKEVPAEAVNEMIAHYALPVSKDMPRADECFDEVIFPELGRSEAQKHLEEMKCILKSAPKLSEGGDSLSYSGESIVKSLNTPSSVTVGGHWQSSKLLSPHDRSWSPLQVKSLCFGTPDLPSGGAHQPRAAESSMLHHRPYGNYNSGSTSVSDSYERSFAMEPYLMPRTHSPVPVNSVPYVRHTAGNIYSAPVNNVSSSVDRPIYGDRMPLGPSAYLGEARRFYGDHRLSNEASYGREGYFAGRSTGEHFGDSRSAQFARGPLSGPPTQWPGTYGSAHEGPYRDPPPPRSSMLPREQQWRPGGYPSPGPWYR